MRRTLCDDGNNAVNALVLQSVLTANTDLTIDGDRVVLNTRNPGHLNRSLQGKTYEQSPERGPVPKEFQV